MAEPQCGGFEHICTTGRWQSAWRSSSSTQVSLFHGVKPSSSPSSWKLVSPEHPFPFAFNRCSQRQPVSCVSDTEARSGNCLWLPARSPGPQPWSAWSRASSWDVGFQSLNQEGPRHPSLSSTILAQLSSFKTLSWLKNVPQGPAKRYFVTRQSPSSSSLHRAAQILSPSICSGMPTAAPSAEPRGSGASDRKFLCPCSRGLVGSFVAATPGRDPWLGKSWFLPPMVRAWRVSLGVYTGMPPIHGQWMS